MCFTAIYVLPHTQAYISGDFLYRSDWADYKTLKRAEKILKSGVRGCKGERKAVLRIGGMRNLPSFLWRNPLVDSTKLLSGGDRLHNDWLGPVKRLQTFLVKAGAPFGSAQKGSVVNYWLSLFRTHGVAGLIADHKLFTQATVQVRPSAIEHC